MSDYESAAAPDVRNDLHPFVVTAPASTANLGPGFDVAGAALELRNRLVVTPGRGGIEVVGAGADDLPSSDENLVVQALEQAAPGYHALVDLRCENTIPIARGLGSSCAAAAVGLVAGWTLTGERWDATRLANELTAIEGHADNAAACAHGGVTLAQRVTPDEVSVLRLDPPSWLVLLAVIPDRPLSTAKARAALPASYDRPTAARAVGNAALLSAGLALGNRAAFASAVMHDVLHEPYRSALVPELALVRDAIADTPAIGATLSGAGPTVAVWCAPEDSEVVADRIADCCPELRVERLEIARRGICVEH